MPEAPGLLSVGVISTLLVSRFRLEGTSEPEGAKTKTVSPSVASKLETVAVAQWLSGSVGAQRLSGETFRSRACVIRKLLASLRLHRASWSAVTAQRAGGRAD